MAKWRGVRRQDLAARDEHLRLALTYAGYAIRLGVGRARERFLELRPASAGLGHYELCDAIDTLTASEVRTIGLAAGAKRMPGSAILAELGFRR